MVIKSRYDTVIVGAGAAGMMCAAHAGARVLVIEHAKKPGEKIRISGGGRCNFTNLHASPANYISSNPHFVKSALARYTQWDFIGLVASYGIAYHEKTLGQLFCDDTARDIIDMLVAELTKAGAELVLTTSVVSVERDGHSFELMLSNGQRVVTENLVICTGGKSIPKMGATGFAYDVARHFAVPVTDLRPALVPLTFPGQRFASLAGVSLAAEVSTEEASFPEAMLFTHRGLSGPAILQISSYWREGDEISVDLLPGIDLYERLRLERQSNGRRNLTTVLTPHLPTKLVALLAQELDLSGTIAERSDAALKRLAGHLKRWRLTPGGSEGYRTAEVTLGGISTEALSSKTMECKTVPGLYFIGEAVDVTGWLGGYNFQWAWSSGWAAGTAIASR